MSKIVGFETVSFVAKDGTRITGNTYHTTTPIPSDRGVGEKTDHFFLSAAKIAALDFTPAVNQEVQVLYSRYGKPASLVLVSAPEVEIDIE